ncbi:MAG: hypothetical protein WCK76_12720, partial [Elusimicrobiota bacterium]
ASSELGGGVRVSSNVYVVGFASATKFFGDASSLTNVPGDNLGNHTAAMDLNMSSYNVTGSGALTMSSITATGAGVSAGRLTLAENVEISSEPAAELGAGVKVSSNVYIVGFASAAHFYGDGSGLTNVVVPGDNLGDHTATRALDMAGHPVLAVSSLTVTGAGVAETEPAFAVTSSTFNVLANGNVGVGVANPVNKLEIASPGGSSMQFDTSVPGIVTIRMGGVAVAEILP